MISGAALVWLTYSVPIYISETFMSRMFFEELNVYNLCGTPVVGQNTTSQFSCTTPEQIKLSAIDVWII